jgi:hypothetical protein
VLTLLTFACRAPESGTEADATWVGTMTTEGAVTTVVNESGSVWGGTATLVEEASIGVETGADEYMFGRVTGISAHGDRIYVVDSQVPAVRLYDMDGVYLGDLGGRGQGPGEYQLPLSIGVADDGTVFVHDAGGGSLLVYSAEGEPINTIRPSGLRVSGGPAMVVTVEVEAYILVVIPRDDPDDELRVGRMPYSRDGTAGEPFLPPQFEDRAYVLAESEAVLTSLPVPFAPNGTYALAPSRILVVGVPDAYGFELRHPDGRTTVVHGYWDPVPVDAGEADHQQRFVTAKMRRVDPSWTWDAGEIPAFKPAFESFVPAVSGEVWVIRPGAGEVTNEECPSDVDGLAELAVPCWSDRRIIDVFGADGRFSGAVEDVPEIRLGTRPYIDGDTIIAHTEDELGTIRVKRYRLVLPGE